MSAKKKTRTKPALESPYQALVRLQQEIASSGHPGFAALVFSEPITAAQITEAEQRLGVPLPPSYVELVTQHGLFKLTWDAPPEPGVPLAYADFEQLHGCRALLSPQEIADETLQLREELADTDDDELAAQLAECLLFQENYYRDNFWVFRSSDRLDGIEEYSVHGYYHDDSFEWTRERIDFASHIREWVQAVLAER